ncbi:Hypothetical predicted protein [Podarcis lilfordi]|uniref:Uncharacterized protein n=1 Tax=Podarcis lilfordi TaxID=74358 RepID=A0AA35K415_9SAUR|nr:Hypothetical predicted protein [Podarcis lilfordi]
MNFTGNLLPCEESSSLCNKVNCSQKVRAGGEAIGPLFHRNAILTYLLIEMSFQKRAKMAGNLRIPTKACRCDANCVSFVFTGSALRH